MARICRMLAQVAVLWGLALGVALPALAQARSVAAALSALPPEVGERIAARPDRWRELALGMVHGHGHDGALMQADLDRAAALDRAYFRARAATVDRGGSGQ